MTDDFVTQGECEDRRKEVLDMIRKNTDDILDLKTLIVEDRASRKAYLDMLKAIFAVLAPGIVSIIVILITRGV